MNEAGGDITSTASIEAVPRDSYERLHPLTVIAGLGGVVRSVWGAIAGSAFLFYSGRPRIALYLIGAVLLSSFVSPLLRYLSFSYRVGTDDIELKSGILNRNHRSIPFDRVQDVNLEQNPIARLLGLARVKMETGASASGGSEDGVIDSIRLEQADALRDLIRSHRAGDIPALRDHDRTEEKIEETPIFSMGHKRLALLSVFNFSLAVVGGLFGLMQAYGDALGIDPFSQSFWRDLLAESEQMQQFVLANRVVTIALGILSLLFVGLLTGVLRTVPRDWGFRLDRTETGFRRRRGLFTLTDVVMPLKRVQAAILATGPLRRRYGFHEMKLQSLARESAKVGDHVVAPLATLPESGTILERMTWRPLDLAREWHRPSKAYIWSFVVVVVPVFLLIVAAATFAMTRDASFGSWPVYAILAALVLLIGGRVLGWHHRRHSLDGDRILIRSGWWRERLVVLPLEKIQSADVHHSFIERWFGISSVKLGVAGGSGFSAHGVVALPREQALALRDELLAGQA